MKTPTRCCPVSSPEVICAAGRLARRGGVSWLGLLVALTLVAGAGGLIWFALTQRSSASARDATVTHRVSRGLYSHMVTEKGELESSSNIEVRCEVQSRNTGGTAILDIVPEGSVVQKGDLLVRLDGSALENERNQQLVVVNASEANKIKAQSTLETARIAREEYLNGTFRQEEQTTLSEIAVAEENLSRAEDFAAYSRKLAAKGYVTQLQLDADDFAVEKAKMELDKARTKLEVLRKYTKAKMLTQLDADIRAGEAGLASMENTLVLDQEKLDLINAQIAKCEMRAPEGGQVVYANQTEGGRGGGNEIIIQPGTLVRERQVIIRLPDPKKMQVKASIPESRIDQVVEGMTASIRLDAFPEGELAGLVTKVEEYPTPGNWWSNTKEYATYIQIQDPPEGRLRPGMTAQVEIHVEQLDDALQVPVQAIVEHGGEHYCLVEKGGGPVPTLSAAKVKIGSTNDKFVVIQEGLSENDLVLVNPRKFLDLVDLPDVSEAEKAKLLARRPPPKRAPAGERERPSGGLAETTATVATTAEPASDTLAQADPAETTEASTSAADGSGTDVAPAEGGEQPRRRRREGGAPGGMGQMDPTQMAGMIMQRLDSDGDGKISKEEMPEGEGRDRFDQTDANKDGFVDAAEMGAAIGRRMKAMQAGGGMGGPGGGPGGGPPAGGGGR